ncbi:MAG: hypothetical protein M3Q69_18320 [Acidobacteriota bacterium]|nr:hypothetical protein [Acidobacteriota bacterium]
MNEANTAACTSCGLLLINAAPKRRAEDLAGKRRRASDLDSAGCRFCSGAIPQNAIKCKHCGEVVDEDFYRERAHRVRARINYASWVLYLFGLGALLVFRPVGVVSIAAGLLFSIAYYAIPVEPPSSPRSKRQTPFGTILKQQLKFERVSIGLPALRSRKLVFVGTPLVAALIGYSANVILLQEPVNDILHENAAFKGMEVSAHYEYYVVPGVVVYDLKNLSFRQTPIDVHTAFLEFAKRLKAKRYSRVDLSYRGTTKFSIDGASFMRLGEEYAKRNFEYVLYNVPRLVKPAEGGAPMPANATDRDTLLEFHRRWYGSDQLTRTVANGL